mgnify:CR=1 FL=1
MPHKKPTFDPLHVTNLVSPPVLADLRQSYQDGKLRILVGAGSSIASGLPNWSTFNRRLVSNFFSRSTLAECLGSIKEIDVNGKEIMSLLTHKVYEDEELRALEQAFEDEFGKDAMIDLLRDQISEIARLCATKDSAENLFDSYLHEALYKDANPRNKLQPLHYELACAALGNTEERTLYTINYDDLLEDALRTVLRASGKETKGVKSIAQGNVGDLSVVHLHGYLPRSGRRSKGKIILSERDYLSDSEGWADNILKNLIQFDDTDLLLVGTSLSDPRIKRLLHKRLEAKKLAGKDRGKVYAILSRNQGGDSIDLAQKRAKEIVKAYSELYWKSWDISVIFIDNYELVPCLIRQIRLGLNPGEWVTKGRDYLKARKFYETLYSDEKQVGGQVYLMRQYAFLRDKFEIPLDEQININVFIPCEDESGQIQLGFQFAGDFRKLKQNSKWVPIATGEKALSWQFELAPYYHQVNDKLYFQTLDEKHAKVRRLDVSSWSKVQGASGFSLLSGTALDASNESKWFYYNFEETQLNTWDKERVYSSLLAIPVYDSPEWVPVAVISLTSTKKQPFWQRLDQDEQRNLFRSLRSTVRNLLGYESSF